MFMHGKTFSRNHITIVKGLSFFEQLIVLILVGILMYFAIPRYTQHVVKSHRLEAEITLKKIAAALEEFYMTHQSYTGATLASMGFDSSATYTFQLAANEVEYQLSATPLATQAEDDNACGILTLNSMGEIGIFGPGNVKECW